LKHRAVYRIDEFGAVVEVTHQVSKPNGVALSPDGKTLYVADHDNGTDKIDPNSPPPEEGDMAVYAYPLGDDGLVNGPRRTLIDFGHKGCDGMTVDSKGNLYLTIRDSNRPGVMVMNPKGKEVGFIPTGPVNQKVDADNKPTGLPSNVEFGIGAEKNVLYITVDTSLYRIPLKAKGFHVQYGD
jgi:gluconolactonase